MYDNPLDLFDPAALAEIEESYDAAQIRQREKLLPRGRYRCRVESFVVRISEEDIIYAFLNMRVIRGPYEGEKLKKAYTVKSEYIEILKNDLALFGVDLTGNLKALGSAELAERMAGCEVSAAVKQKERDGIVYQSVYLNKVSLAQHSQNIPLPDPELLVVDEPKDEKPAERMGPPWW